MAIRALLAVEAPEQRRRLKRLLEESNVDVVSAVGTGAMWQRLTQADVDFVIVVRSLIPDPPVPFVSSIRELPEHAEVIVFSQAEDPVDRAKLLAAGCMAVLYDPLPDAALLDALRTLVGRRQDEMVRGRRIAGPGQRYSLDDFVSASPAMQAFLAVARRVVNSDSSLLVLGETGVGKERLARAIHSESPRSAGPMVAVNCGALPEGLLESELFGHEQGAFTGAARARRGYFELADGGTIFLDEIADFPLHLQVKLLRVLEDHTVQRVGSERTVPVNVRVMAATNRHLDGEVKAKRFRTDLFYRLAVVALTIPPLRDRREDIPDLVRSYLGHFGAHLGRQVNDVSPDAMEALTRYSWPGNVRELINVIERAVLLCAGPIVGLDDLPRAVAVHADSEGQRSDEMASLAASFKNLQDAPLMQARQEVVSAFERIYLGDLLRATRGRIGETAKRAGVNERSLYQMMRRHGLRKEDFK